MRTNSYHMNTRKVGMVVSHKVGVENSTQACCKSNKCSTQRYFSGSYLQIHWDFSRFLTLAYKVAFKLYCFNLGDLRLGIGIEGEEGKQLRAIDTKMVLK